MHTFYVSDHIHPDVLARLQTMGLVHCHYGTDPVAFGDVADTVDAVLLRAENFDADMITAATRLKIIARHGTGTDNVDIDAATTASVWVTTTPGANSAAVAEHVFALLLAVARKTAPASTGTAAGQWASIKPSLNGFELGGRVLGLVGFGRIARHVARIANGFGMNVIAADPYLDAAAIRAGGATPVTRDVLLRQADVISLHAPLTPDTRHLIDRDVLAGMRPGAVVINTSRGELIDEEALIDAPDHGPLAAAAIDVVEGETIDMRDPLQHSYLRNHLGRPDLMVTPHIAGQSDEAFLAAGAGAIKCIEQALRGEVPDNAVTDIRNPATIFA